MNYLGEITEEVFREEQAKSRRQDLILTLGLALIYMFWSR